jgi:hypothetical protein
MLPDRPIGGAVRTIVATDGRDRAAAPNEATMIGDRAILPIVPIAVVNRHTVPRTFPGRRAERSHTVIRVGPMGTDSRVAPEGDRSPVEPDEARPSCRTKPTRISGFGRVCRIVRSPGRRTLDAAGGRQETTSTNPVIP